MRAHGRVGASAYTINLFPPPFLSPSLLCRRAKRGRGVGRETFCHACVPPWGGTIRVGSAAPPESIFREQSRKNTFILLYFLSPARRIFKRKKYFCELACPSIRARSRAGVGFSKRKHYELFSKKKVRASESKFDHMEHFIFLISEGASLRSPTATVACSFFFL